MTTTASRIADADKYLTRILRDRTDLSYELTDPATPLHRKDWIRAHGLRIADMEIAEVRADIDAMTAAAEPMRRAA